jgi:hypothetical protein
VPDQDEDVQDLSQDDLDDLGDLGGGDTDEDDESDEDQDDAEGSDGKPYKPPSKSEWDRTQKRIKRLLDEKKGRKGGGADIDRQLQRQISGKGKADDKDADEPEDTSEADRWRGIAVQNAAASQIAAAGFTGTAKQAARLAKLIDMDDVRPNRDGTFDLEDEIEELQEEYPQLFQAVGSGRRPAPNVRRADNRKAAPKDPTQATSDALLASAGLSKRRRSS